MSDALLEPAIPSCKTTGGPPFLPALRDADPRLPSVALLAEAPGVDALLALGILGLASRGDAMSTLALRFRLPRLSLNPDFCSIGVGGMTGGGIDNEACCCSAIVASMLSRSLCSRCCCDSRIFKALASSLSLMACCVSRASGPVY